MTIKVYDAIQHQLVSVINDVDTIYNPSESPDDTVLVQSSSSHILRVGIHDTMIVVDDPRWLGSQTGARLVWVNLHGYIVCSGVTYYAFTSKGKQLTSSLFIKPCLDAIAQGKGE